MEERSDDLPRDNDRERDSQEDPKEDPKEDAKEEQDQELEIDNLPNRITIFRMFLIPIIIGCLLAQLPVFLLGEETKILLGWLAAWTFVLASITDFLDGHIARKRNIVTIFGSFLDPVADKFLIVSAIISLQALNRIHVFMVIVLVLREIYITSLRLLASTEGLKVPVDNFGKWKTATQMIGLPMLMANQTPWGIPLPFMGEFFLYVATVLSVYSSFNYSLGLLRKLRALREEKKRLRKNRKKARAQK